MHRHDLFIAEIQLAHKTCIFRRFEGMVGLVQNIVKGGTRCDRQFLLHTDEEPPNDETTEDREDTGHGLIFACCKKIGGVKDPVCGFGQMLEKPG